MNIRCSATGRFISELDAANFYGKWYHESRVPLYNGIYDDGDDDRYYIDEHDFKPTPVFHGGHPMRDLLLGIELEIDRGGHSETNAKKIAEVANKGVPIFSRLYVKHDGSLRDGIELVSHPATLNYHMNRMPWRDVLNECRRLGYRSHEARTCGLHVHISRNYFGHYADEQEAGIMKLVYLVEKFWEQLLKFSRRTQSQIDEWARRYGLAKDETPKELIERVKSSRDRYRAVNLRPFTTVEIRMFRGTLLYATFIATIQMAYALAYTANNFSVEDIVCMTWEDFTRVVEFPELDSYLIARELK